MEDARTDDRFKDYELVTGEAGLRFYAGYPLTDPQGYILGTLSVIDHQPRRLTDSKKRTLELLAREATNPSLIALLTEF